MRGEWEVGLAGMVVMMGAAQTTEAERCELSRSILGLDGSSAVGPGQNQFVTTWCFSFPHLHVCVCVRVRV